MGNPGSREIAPEANSLSGERHIALLQGRLLWILLAVSGIGIGATGCVDRPPAAVAAPQCVNETIPDVDLIVAGSGSALPLVERIVEAHGQRGTAERVWVPGSIGSQGAIAALSAGEIDIGLVSRPVQPGELVEGSELRVFAFSVVAFHVHTRLESSALSMDMMRRMYDGEVRAWPDGTPVVLLLREEGDSSLMAVEDNLPELHASMERSRAEGRAVTIYTDQDMLAALIRTPGAVGLLDRGLAVQGPPVLRPVPIAGELPNSSTIRNGAWPLLKPLYLVLQPDASPDVVAFADAIARYAAQEDIARFGYAPPTGGR